MRKIRAYNRGDFRNTAVLAVTEIRTFFGFFENGLPVVSVLHSLKHPAAFPGHEAVEPLVVGACRMRIPGLNAYMLAFGQANVIRTQSESVSLRFEEKFYSGRGPGLCCPLG